MHWIRKMRLEKGWSQKELAQRAGCSTGLIDMLEEANGEVTHWQIANRIAGTLGVGKAERDSIIPESRRDEPYEQGQPKEDPVPQHGQSLCPDKREAEIPPRARLEKERIVVVFDRNGMEIDRVAGYDAVAQKYHISIRTLKNTLYARRPENEFMHRDYSFRDLSEWDALGGKPYKAGRKSPAAREIVVIDKDDREVERLASVWAAERAYGCSSAIVYACCNPHDRPMDEFRQRDVTFRYARDWDREHGGQSNG